MWLAILDVIGYHIHLYVEMAPNLRVITSLKQKTMTQAVHTPNPYQNADPYTNTGDLDRSIGINHH